MLKSKFRKTQTLTILFSCLLLINIPVIAQIQPTKLEPNQTIEREMTGAETHQYKISLKKFDIVQIQIEQIMINVSFRFMDSEGNELIVPEDLINSKSPLKVLSFKYIAAADKDYYIEISFSKTEDRNQKYKIKQEILRKSTESERVFLADFMAYKANKSGGEADLVIKKSQISEQKQNKNSFTRLVKKSIAQYKEASLLYTGSKKDIYRILCLTMIGDNFRRTGEISESLNYLNDALKLTKAKGLYAFLPSIINQIARIYLAEGQEERALAYLQQLDLENFENWERDKNLVSESLNLLSYTYTSLGDVEDYDKSIKIFSRLIDYFTKQPIGNFKYDEIIPPDIYKDGYLINLYGSLGKASTEAGYYSNAIASYEKAIEISLSIKKKLKFVDGDKSKELLSDAVDSESNSKNNIGICFLRTGNFREAEKYINEALTLATQENNDSFIIKWKANLSGIYARQKKFEKGLKGFDETLPQLEKLRDEYAARFKESKNLNDRLEEVNLAAFVGIDLYYYGTILRETGKFQDAIKYHNDSIKFLNIYKFKKFEARARVELGLDYLAINKPELAEKEFTKAYWLAKSIRSRDEQAVALDGAMRAWQNRDNNRAIFFGKQSVNLLQITKLELQKLGKNIASEFVKDNQDTYRKLADLLIARGSFAQAEKVLAMLKAEEYFDFVRRDANEIKSLGERVPLSDKENALIARYSQLADKITEIGLEFQKLDDKKKKLPENVSLPPDEKKRYAELEKQLDNANAAFKLFLEKELVAELGQQRKVEIEFDRNLQDKLRKWGKGTVALYTVAGEKRYRVILTTPTVQIDGKTEIEIANLNKKVFDFRAALQNPKVDPRPLGKELYDILLKPIEKELKQANARTLVWSLDGTLRYIPLAALSPDGKRYLTEDYQNVIITPKTRDDLTVSDANWRALGLGVSEEQTVTNPDDNAKKIFFSKLPGTERELLAIIKNEDAQSEKGILNGRRFINKDFTIDNFKDSLTKETVDGKRKYNIVHIASHFSLGGNWSNSFLLLGNGEILSLEKMNNSSTISFGDVELITLSACNTGFADDSNGKEIDSLATVIQNKSGKAVLATLWAVADESTALLMSEFYRLRKENPTLTKAEAIQNAQQAMISGKLKSDGKNSGCRTSEIIDLDEKQTGFKCNSAAPFSHPYYWSPFVLIGNWK